MADDILSDASFPPCTREFGLDVVAQKVGRLGSHGGDGSGLLLCVQMAHGQDIECRPEFPGFLSEDGIIF
jgi:hypothetical protein